MVPRCSCSPLSLLLGLVGASMAMLLSPIPTLYAETPEPTIVFLGSFYSEIQGEEYLYQDQIDLWREGSKIFGLTASSWGGSTRFDRFQGTLNEKSGSLYLSESMMLGGFRGRLKDKVLTGAKPSEAQLQYRLARDPIHSHAAQAPKISYERWRAWADSLIDDAEAKDPSIQSDITKCNAGDTGACLNVGNGLTYRKPEEAKRYWRIACDHGAWPGCKFLGDQDRYLTILHRLCSSSANPSLDRNMACEELGKVAEKAGRVDEAIGWYQIGCNDYKWPTICCDRLKALGHAGR